MQAMLWWMSRLHGVLAWFLGIDPGEVLALSLDVAGGTQFGI